MRKSILPLLLVVFTSNACVIVNPKDIDTSLDSGFQSAGGAGAATIEVSRPDKFNGMKAAYIVLENETIVGTLANAGTLVWSSKEGRKEIRLEQVQPINCQVFPGRDNKCFEDKKNQYVRTDQGGKCSISLDLKSGQTYKIRFVPNMFGKDTLSFDDPEHQP